MDANVAVQPLFIIPVLNSTLSDVLIDVILHGCVFAAQTFAYAFIAVLCTHTHRVTTASLSLSIPNQHTSSPWQHWINWTPMNTSSSSRMNIHERTTNTSSSAPSVDLLHLVPSAILHTFRKWHSRISDQDWIVLLCVFVVRSHGSDGVYTMCSGQVVASRLLLYYYHLTIWRWRCWRRCWPAGHNAVPVTESHTYDVRIRRGRLRSPRPDTRKGLQVLLYITFS